MSNSFFSLGGFFVCWPDGQGGTCRVFSRNKDRIDELFATLASKNDKVEKYQVKNGKMKKLA